MSKVAGFLIYAFSTLWFIAFYIVILPWMILEMGKSLDWLVWDYIFNLNLSSWLEAHTVIQSALQVFGLAVFSFGLLIALKAWYDLAGRGKFYPLVIFQKEHLGPEKLVTAGLYGRVRHPMFLAYLICLAGISIYGMSLLALLWIVPLIGFLGIEWYKETEEKELFSWFGSEYKEYQEKTPAIVPRLGKNSEKKY